MKATSQQTPKRKWQLPAVVLAVIALIAGAYFLYGYERPYNFKYKTLTTYKLADDKYHAGLSVLKPAEFVWQPTSGLAGARIIQQPAQARFIHQQKISGQQVIIGQMALNSVFTPPGLKTSGVDLIDRLMEDSKDPGHQAVVLPMENYANNLLNPDVNRPAYKLSFEQPAALKNPGHAWIINFQAAASSKKRTTPDMQGVVAEVYGKNGQYFMALDAARVNWQANQSVWQQIINSLKIDQ